MITIYQKAEAIATKLEMIMDRSVIVSPERVLELATPDEITFYYVMLIEKGCKSE